tara:strand:+ start:180 stop:392 length:213 start_codon:yes stop_codon:yes gene_type:complete
MNSGRYSEPIKFPHWKKDDYISQYGVDKGTIYWLENENRNLKNEIHDIKYSLKSMEKRVEDLLSSDKFKG